MHHRVEPGGRNRGGAGADGTEAWPGWGIVLPLLAALPSALAAAHAVRVGWVPIADEGVIALRSHDVLSARSPSLGQLSLASTLAGRATRSPGPAGYWPFALAVRAGPTWLPAVTAAALNGALAAACVRVARRRGGVALMAAVAVGLVLVARGVGPVHLASTWNPSVGLVPMVLLVLLAWSVAVGDRHLLPATVAVASFAAHLHLAHLLPAMALVAAAVAAGWGPEVVRAGRDRLARGRPVPAPIGGGAGLVGALVVGAGFWAAPLWQQVTGDPGNLTLVRQSSQGPTEGPGFALGILAWAVGLPPAFLRREATGGATLDRLTPDAGSTVVLGAALVGLALLTVVAIGGLRRRREAVAPAVVVLAGGGAAVVTFAATPHTQAALSVTYSTLWLVGGGMVAWVAVAAGAVRLASEARSGRRRPGRLAVDRRLVGGTLVVVVVAAALVAVLTPVRDPEAPLYGPIGRIAAAATERVEPGHRYAVAVPGTLGLQVGPAIAYRARRAGATPVLAGFDGRSAGPDYVPSGQRCAAVVTVTIVAPGADDPTAPAGGEVLLVVDVPATDVAEAGTAVVTWAPDDGPPSC